MFRCEICTKEYTTKQGKSSHKRWHNKEFRTKMVEKSKINNTGSKNPMYGKIPWNKGLAKEKQPFYGKKHNDRVKNKIASAQLGEKNHQWKGNEAGYQAIHIWIRSQLTKPERCQKCYKKKSDLDCCNISGEYKRTLDDWQYLCRSCHTKYDKRHSSKRKIKRGKFVEDCHN